MKEKSMLIPPKGAEKLASRLEPPEYGTVHWVNSRPWPQFQMPHTHRDLVFVAYFRNLGYLFSRFWVCDSDRELINVDRGPLGIAVQEQILVVRANGIGSQGISQFANRLV